MKNLLKSKWGRLLTFFFCYLTEGLPAGFTLTAVATQMRRQGVDTEQVGVFMAALSLPWAFKWVMGPFVDTLKIRRFGPRKQWIIVCQVAMIALLGLSLNLTTDLKIYIGLFTTLMVIHNSFAATQDVAIDALACGTLRKHERGLANGLMFGGATLGAMMGGSFVLFLTDFLRSQGLGNEAFTYAGLLVPAVILTVLAMVVIPLREPIPEKPGGEDSPHQGLVNVVEELKIYVATAGKELFTSRRSLSGVLYAMLPPGSFALTFTIGAMLGVGIGMSDKEIAFSVMVAGLIASAGNLAGGALSDYLGRRRMITIFTVLTLLPSLWMAWVLQQAGWIFPLEVGDPRIPSPHLKQNFILCGWGFSAIQGMLWSARPALFMDICNPKIAATQFTAYMAMINLVMAYTPLWQGYLLSHPLWGYPKTMLLDCVFGLVSLPLLLLIRPPRERSPDPQASHRPAKVT